MKKLLFGLIATSILAACGQAANAPSESNNSTTSPSTTSTNTNTPPAPAASKIEGLSLKLTYNDSLYVGAANPFRIDYPNANNLLFEVESSQLRLAKKEEGNNSDLFLLPTAAGLKAKMVHLSVTDTVTKQSQQFNYPVRPLPKTPEDFVFSINGKTAGNIAAKDFKTFDSLSISIKNIPLDIAYEIESYDLLYKHKKQDPIRCVSSDTKITGQALQAIKHAQKGDIYTFTRIKVKTVGMIVGQAIPDVQFVIN